MYKNIRSYQKLCNLQWGPARRCETQLNLSRVTFVTDLQPLETWRKNLRKIVIPGDGKLVNMGTSTLQDPFCTGTGGFQNLFNQVDLSLRTPVALGDIR
jgi:hypothetical protein